MEMEKLSFPLVSQLAEGFYRGGVYIITGPPGVGKSVFVKKLIMDSIKDNYILFVSCDSSPKEMVEFLEKVGLGDKRDRIILLDSFSSTLTGIKQEPVFDKIDLGDTQKSLFDLYSKLSQIHGKKLLIIDSITEVMLGSDPNRVISLLKGLKQISESTNTISILTMHSGPEGLQDVLWVFEYLSDGFVELGYEPNFESVGILLRRIRVRKMRGVYHDTNWYPFKIGKNYSVQFYSKEEMKALAEAVTGKKQSE